MNYFELLRGPAMEDIGKFVQGSGMLDGVFNLIMSNTIATLDDGRSWVGPGADAFRAKLTGQSLPACSALSGQLTSMNKFFTDSIQRIDEADDLCQRSFAAVGDICAAVF